jgi:hypothetical protein
MESYAQLKIGISRSFDVRKYPINGNYGDRITVTVHSMTQFAFADTMPVARMTL